MAHLILAGAGVLALYVLLALARPSRRCRRCKGQRITRSRITGRLLACPRCHGLGRDRRLGATAVHRFWWSVIGDRVSARLRQRTED